jgi:hypothetical protein
MSGIPSHLTFRLRQISADKLRPIALKTTREDDRDSSAERAEPFCRPGIRGQSPARLIVGFGRTILSAEVACVGWIAGRADMAAPSRRRELRGKGNRVWSYWRYNSSRGRQMAAS